MNRYFFFMILLCIVSLLIVPVVADASTERVACMYDSGRTLGLIFEKYDTAIEVLDVVIEMDPGYTDAYGNNVYTTKGLFLFELKRYNEAIEVFNAATKVDATQIIAWSSKGDTLLKLDRYDEALEAYDTALELDPDHWLSLRGKSDTLYALGRDAEASELSAKADSIYR